MNQKQLIGLSLGCLAAGALPAEAPSPAEVPGLAAARTAIEQALPGTAITSVSPSPLPGLVEVVAGSNLLYVDTSGRWLVIGHLYDLATATDVTAERMREAAHVLRWADLPFDAAVHYGSGPLELAVFADPDCPWCRKLHAELRTRSDIRAHEILYPLPMLHPDAEEKALQILCAADPPAALDRVMAGGSIQDIDASPACLERAQAAVERAMGLGERAAIRGTPTLIAPDGRTHAGYLTPAALEAWLRGKQPTEEAVNR